MKVGLLQSNYLPWKGYYDLISAVDLFVFHDDLQYTKNDWRNRNKIKTPNGATWISIPCGTNQKRLINEVRVDQIKWQNKHFSIIQENYKDAPYWNYCLPLLEYIYHEQTWDTLSNLNQSTIKKICKDYLSIQTAFTNSEKFNLQCQKQSRVIELLRLVEATGYVSGPSASNYLDPRTFAANNITLSYFSYDAYQPYPQKHMPFSHFVSIIDLLMSTGPSAKEFLLTKACG